jgi:hypothetical protein
VLDCKAPCLDRDATQHLQNRFFESDLRGSGTPSGNPPVMNPTPMSSGIPHGNPLWSHRLSRARPKRESTYSSLDTHPSKRLRSDIELLIQGSRGCRT